MFKTLRLFRFYSLLIFMTLTPFLVNEMELQGHITIAVLLAAIIMIPKIQKRAVADNNRTYMREQALNEAKIFLSPYTSIWKNLRLSNKFCAINLLADGVSIVVVDKTSKTYKSFKVVSSKVHSIEDLWNMFCISFNHNTTYNSLVEDSRTYKLVIKESYSGGKSTLTQSKKTKNITKEKLDINNCSEIELTELPGISIVQAKKIIKKREEIGGFKNVEEFFDYIKPKPHIEIQLRDSIFAEKIKGKAKIEKSSERRIDL